MDLDVILHQDVPCSSSTPYSDATNCKKIGTSHIKRPMNAFMVWSKLERQKILEHTPDLHNAEISIQLGERWRKLTEEERKPFLKEANRLRELHSQEYPEYKFKPKKKVKRSPESKKDSKFTSQRMQNLQKMLHNTPVLKNPSPLKSILCAGPLVNSTSNFTPVQWTSSSTGVNESMFNEGLPENVSASSVPLNDEKINKFSNKKPDLKEMKVTVDKNTRKKFKSEKLIALDRLCSNFPVNEGNPEGDVSTSDSKKESPHLKEFKNNINGSVTSGPLCAISNANPDEWSETFDFLVDNVIKNTKDAHEDIKELAIHYKTLRQINMSDGFYFIESKIPSLSDILGDQWNDDTNEFNFNFLS